MQPKVNFKVGLPVAILICPHPFSYAEPAHNTLPSHGQVVAGRSTISQQGNNLTINQGSQKAIINWQDYNIGRGAAVNYKQPNASAVSLNRVVSPDPSQINGKLNANGQVWVVNPNGVVFGKNAQVNLGGLVVSTLNIKDADFLKQKKAEFTGDGTGKVVNSGRITAKNGGYVALLAPEVRNEGMIAAKQGTVAMAAGEKMTLDFHGDKLVNVQVEPSKIKALVENNQLIKADGGQVLMTTSAADSLQTSVINNSGKIEASSMTSDGGVVRLAGAQTVLNSGVISANSNTGKGGKIELLGTNVGVMAHGKVDVSGKTGGGTILVGGDYQGKNPTIQNAQKTYIGKEAKLIADATDKGNGGKVIAWADGITRYHGSISAKGGKHGGNGGFSEVSGKRLLEFSGKADLSADRGKGGNLLLDPLNITLTNTADTNTTGFTPPGDLTEAFADDAGSNSNFNVTAGTGSFAGITAGSTITLQATNDITVSNAFDIATATGAVNNSLVLQANNNININAAVTATGSGSISMTADADNSGAGDLSLSAGLVTANNAINLSGFRVSSNTSGTINSAGGAVTVASSATSTLSGSISGTGTTFTKNGMGTITLTGANSYTGATQINAGTLISTSGRLPNASAINVGPAGTLTLNTSDIVGSLAGTGNVILNGTSTLSAGSDNTNTTFSGVVSGAGNFTKQGAGSMTLSGSNTYMGTTTVSAGTLVADNPSALGATSGGTTINSGATLNINNAAIGNEAISIAGNGVGGNGVLTGTGSASLAGNVTQTAASTIGTANAASSLALGGIYTATASATTIGGTGSVTAVNPANNFNAVAISNGNDVNLVDANALTLNTSNVRKITARTLSSDLTLGGNITATGDPSEPTSITLAAAGNFMNAGNFSLTPGNSKNWLVYSTNPTLDTRGAGLLSSFNFKQYNTTYPGTILGAGNGFIYSAAPTITASLVGTATKVYDGTAAAPIAGLALNQSGAIDGDTVSLSGLASVTYDNKNTGTGKTVTANALSITGASNGGKTVFGYTLASPTANAAVGTITTAALSLDATNDTKVYDGTTTSGGAVSTGGLVGGDTVTGLSQSFASKNVLGANGSTLNVNGDFTINDGNGGNNYTVSLNPATGTVTPSALTISANNLGKTYGEELAFSGNEFTSIGLISGETIGRVDLASPGANRLAGIAHGPYAISVGNATGGSFDAINYTISYNGGNLIVNRAPLTIAANDASKLQGEPNPPFSGSISGFVNGENSSVLNGALNFTTPAEPGSPIGFYFIRPFGVASDNYSISFINGTLAVLEQTAPPPTNPPGPNPIPLLAGTVTRPEQAMQTCLTATANNTMLNGMAYFGLDDIDYQASISQPLVGGVVANALVRPSCYKL